MVSLGIIEEFLTLNYTMILKSLGEKGYKNHEGKRTEL